jgi:[ribosomal protein S5]-alanine N-acetyltransferase
MNCIFESERLCFRMWKEEDKKIFSKMNSDPIVMEYFPKLLNEDESNKFYERIVNNLHNNDYGLWAVEIKNDNQFIGFIGFNDTTFKSNFTPCVEIGWRIKKEEWGKGYATEGAKACLFYGFNKIGLKEIFSFTSKTNKRSEKVMIKIGLNKIDEFKHPGIEEGNQLRKHVLYKLTQEEYVASAVKANAHPGRSCRHHLQTLQNHDNGSG